MWLLLLASIWGASYMFIKIGLRDLSPPMVAWARIALAAAVLVPLAGLAGGARGRARPGRDRGAGRGGAGGRARSC